MNDDKQPPAQPQASEIVISDSSENQTPTQTRERLSGQLRPDSDAKESDGADSDSAEPDNEDG